VALPRSDAEHYLATFEGDLEIAVQRAEVGRLDEFLYYARRALEALSACLLIHDRQKPHDELHARIQALVRSYGLSQPVRHAFHVVRAAGNMGSHVQSPGAEASPLEADACAVNLAIVIRWCASIERLELDAGTIDRLAGLSDRLAPHRFGGARASTSIPSMSGDFPSWYREVRPRLLHLAASELLALEEREGWASPSGTASPALHVAVVGQAAVGKSTLLNALLSDRLHLLPAGGVGPHTAGAIAVRYARAPYLELGLVEQRWLGWLHEGVQRQDPLALAAARILLGSGQFDHRPAEELEARLRTVYDDATGADVDDEVRARLLDVREGRRRRRIHSGAELRELTAALDRHASGALSPVTESLELGWDAELLMPGLCLVDLPGFGAAHDRHQVVAQRELRRARALLWVLDRAGITEATYGELRRVRFLERLVAQERGIRLLLAVTRLDESAVELRRRRPKGERPSFEGALAIVFEDVKRMVAQQLRELLAPFSAAQVERALAQVEIFPVAPIDHRRLFLEDDEEPPRVASPEATGIPALRRRLRALAADRRAEAATALDELLQHQAVRSPRLTIDRLRLALSHAVRDSDGAFPR
jgi:hypothetical protein